MATARSELDLLEAQLRGAGWRVRRTNQHRFAFPPSGGRPVGFSSTPSGHKWRRQLVAQLAVHGFDWTPGGASHKKPTGRKASLAVHSTIETIEAEHAIQTSRIEKEDVPMAEPATIPTPAQASEDGVASKVDEVYQALRDRIISGDLAPGTQFATERVMSAELGVRRDSVRRACQRLDDEGLTMVKSRRGGRWVVGVASVPEPVIEHEPVIEALGGDEVREPMPDSAALLAEKRERDEAARQAIEAAPESDIVAQARDAFATLSGIMTGLIEAATKAQADAAEAWALVEAAEERAVAAEAKRDDYEQEVVTARRQARDAEAKVTQARQALGVLAA